MVAFLASRILQAVPVLLAVALIAFCLFAFVGDPVTSMLGQDYTEADRVAMVHHLGLDQPLLVQYGRFVWVTAHGEFGVSYRLGRPVWDLFAERLPATIELSVTASVLALAVGIPLGVYTSIQRTRFVARALMAISLVGVALPTFLLGIVLIMVFSVVLHWLPSFGRGATVQIGGWSTGLLTVTGIEALVLPALTLALFQITLIMRLVRAEMLQAMASDYIRFAIARGLPDRVVQYRHALKNALAPVVTAAGLQLGAIVAFSIVTEQVFQWPGMGLLLVKSIQVADLPVLGAYLMLVAVLFLAINLVADLIAHALDPRLRLSAG